MTTNCINSQQAHRGAHFPRFLWPLVTLLLAGVFTACHPPKDNTAAAAPDTYFPINIGSRTLQLQLALTPTEHQQGLMFRNSLAEDHGMLFLFPRPKPQSFWMKNTRIPLDIGYFDTSGRLVEVHKLFPYDESPVASRSQEILIAIETNRDWYARNGIAPGARLDMEALKAAITKRGHSIANFALND
ncbi:MAG: DUF192 domain-containing protein [Opitutales bacterium]